MTKVVHVHLIFKKENHYFGSISAIFEYLTEEEIGIKKSTLLHSGLKDGRSLPTCRAIITQSHLIRSSSKKPDSSSEI